MKSYVYIITNKCNQVIYIGVTDDLVKRIYQHKNKFVEGFSAKYNLSKLVYYEIYDDIKDAISREKNLKNWHRDWKINQINKFNPNWEDLYKTIF
jgi:putative endonuclease